MKCRQWLVRSMAAGLIGIVAIYCDPGSTQERPQGNPVPAAPTYPDAPAPRTAQANATEYASSQQNSDQRPLGTAAAPDMKPTGVTGSMLSGAAIAPARQRRVRILLISLGVVAAAGIAIGTVAGLSHASPSRPQ